MTGGEYKAHLTKSLCNGRGWITDLANERDDLRDGALSRRQGYIPPSSGFSRRIRITKCLGRGSSYIRLLDRVYTRSRTGVSKCGTYVLLTMINHARIYWRRLDARRDFIFTRLPFVSAKKEWGSVLHFRTRTTAIRSFSVELSSSWRNIWWDSFPPSLPFHRLNNF